MVIMDSSPSLKKLMIKYNVNDYEVVILFDKIQKYFSSCKSEEVKDGYNCIFNCMTKYFCSSSCQGKSNLIMDLFKKELYIKAKKYNNTLICDKNTYDLEVKRMINMCEYLFRYYNDIDICNNEINNAWKRSEQNKINILIGCICVQNNLPGGNPCWMEWMISSYLFSHDEQGFGTLLSK